MKDYMKALARKGEVTIVEHVGGKTIVAIKTSAGVASLTGGTKDQLLAELCQMFQDWPDTPDASRTRQ
jgi:hypothetical protein